MKIHKIVCVFFILNLTIPTYSMFIRMRERLQPGIRNVSNKISPVGENKFIPKKNTIDTMREVVEHFFKAQYERVSSLWEKKSIPISQSPERIQVRLEPVEIKSIFVEKNEAKAESDGIIAKLNGQYPWGYPIGTVSFQKSLNSSLAQELRMFLEKNNVDSIENLFFMCIEKRIDADDPKYMLSDILKDLCKKSEEFIVKIFPLVEKNYQLIDPDLLGTILLGVPSKFLPQAEKAIEFFFRKASYPHLLALGKSDDMVRLLPKDNKKLIRLIKIITDPFREDQLAKKEKLDSSLLFIEELFAKRVSSMKPDDLHVLVGDLLKSEIGVKLLFKFDSIIPLIDYIKAEIDRLLPTARERTPLIFTTIFSDPQLRNILIDHMKTSYIGIKALLQTCEGQYFLLGLIGVDSSLRIALDDYLNTEKDFDSMELSDYLADLLGGSDFVKFAYGLDSNNYGEVPSYRHLVNNSGSLSLLSGAIGHPHIRWLQPMPGPIWRSAFKNMVKICLDTEKESLDEYEVFYHGRRWQYRLLSNFYDMLYSHKTGKNLDGFSFIHFVDPVTKINANFFEKQSELRNLLMKKGNEFARHTHDTEITRESILASVNRGRLLFLNKFLFGNLSNLGSCSVFYIFRNFNINYGNRSFDMAEIFDMFGYRDIYRMYEKELQNLEVKHAKLSYYGELLQILVPKEKVDKCIYYTISGGPKIAFEMSDGSTTSDLKEILNDLDKNPKDIVEFGLVETSDPDGGLSPDSGIKVYSRTLVDPEEMKEFEENDRKPLLNKILASIKQKEMRDAQEHKAALARE